MRFQGTRRPTFLALAAAAVAAATLAGPAGATIECAPIMPTAQVAKGMLGTGWTVERGRDPQPFSVQVLGVLPNEIGPGRDMIVVEASGPMIDRANGIWYGMSGSPIYVNGQLIGALSYGFSATSRVAGLTPAQDMAKILSYPTRPPDADGNVTPPSPPTITLPASMRREIANATGTAAADVPERMVQLKVPLSVSGLNGRAMREVRKFVSRTKLPLIPHSGASASAAPTVSATPLRPGDNFAAVNSYGDVTIAGVGTTSYTCNGRALAFGHPFFFSGATLTGANHADALAIVTDPVWGPFKLAGIQETVGEVDQDRTAGLRATLGTAPETTPIRSSVAVPDLNAQRNGETDVVLPDLTPFVAYLHLLSNIDSTFDAIGEGSSKLSWTITGTRAGGGPWRLSRSNLYASPFDIAFESSEEVASELDILAGNPFEEVRVTGVDVNATVEEKVKLYRIAKVLVATGKKGTLREREMVRVRPGTLVRIRVVLKPYEKGSDRTFNMSFRVRGFPMGMIEITGGSPGGYPCFEGDLMPGDMPEDEEGGDCDSSVPVKSFDALLTFLEKAPKNNVLVTRFRAGERMRLKRERKIPLDAVVRGWRSVFLAPPKGMGGPSEEDLGN